MVAVHNEITGDARVRKTAMTLDAFGFNVKLLGLSDKKKHLEIDGLDAELIGKSAWLLAYSALARSLVQIRKLQKRHLFFVTFCVSLLPLVLLAYAYYSGHWRLFTILIIAAGIALFSLSNMARLREFIGMVRDRYALPIAYRITARKMARTMTLEVDAVIHAHDIIALMAAVEAKRTNPKCIVIWDAHELYTELAYKSAFATRFIDNVIADAAPKIDHFITINDSIAHYYAQRYDALPKANVIMNATRRSDKIGVRSDLLRRAANIDDGQKILLFQGGFSKGRGINIMLAAAPVIPPDWSMVFMGSGPQLIEIEAAAEICNGARPPSRPAVRAISSAPYEELAQWTSGATLGAIPYENTSLNHYYCTPNKLWEYPNAGVPILATALPEMAAMINAHQTGILLPLAFEADDIVKALENLNDDQLHAMRQACETFNAAQNWEKYERKLVSIYQEAGLRTIA